MVNVDSHRTELESGANAVATRNRDHERPATFRVSHENGNPIASAVALVIGVDSQIFARQEGRRPRVLPIE
jgi:hypothetical protein